MKIRNKDLNNIKIDKYLNEQVWFRGIRKPPIKIKVKAVKEGDIVRVELVDYFYKLKFKKLREEKREQKAEEAGKKKKSLIEKVKEPAEKKPEEKTEEEIKDEKEKVKAGAEVTKKIERATAKQMKHQAGGKTKQPKRQIRKALEK